MRRAKRKSASVRRLVGIISTVERLRYRGSEGDDHVAIADQPLLQCGKDVRFTPESGHSPGGSRTVILNSASWQIVYFDIAAAGSVGSLFQRRCSRLICEGAQVRPNGCRNGDLKTGRGRETGSIYPC